MRETTLNPQTIIDSILD